MRKSAFVTLVTTFLVILLFQNCGQEFKSESVGSLSNNPGTAVDILAEYNPIGGNVDYQPGVEEPVKEKSVPLNCYGHYSLELSGYYIRETPFGNAVYYGNSWVVNASLSSFVILNNKFGKDSKYLYFNGSIVAEIQPGDQFSFHPNIDSYAYITNRKKIVNSQGILDVDYDSFEPINEGLYRDKNFSTGILKVVQPNLGAIHLGHGYFNANGKIYYNDNELIGANGSNFRVISNSDFPIGRSGSSIYFQDTKVTNDLGGDIVLRKTPNSGMLWVYNGVVYASEKQLASTSQFIDLGYGWYRYGSVIKHRSYDIPHPGGSWDPNTFQAINEYWAKDSSKLMRYGYQPVMITDPAIGNQLKNSVEGFKVDFVSDAIISVNGKLYLNSDTPQQATIQVNKTDDIECLGASYYRIGNRVFNSTNEVTANWTTLGLDVATVNTYLGGGDNFYDGNGFLNREGVFTAFSNSNQFRPVNQMFYHDGSAFRSVRYNPGNASFTPQKVALFQKPLNSILWKGNSSLVLPSVVSTYTEAMGTVVDTSYVRPLYTLPESFIFNNGYLNGSNLQPVASPQTYERVSNIISRDQVNVYYRGVTIIAGLNPNSITTYSPYGATEYWFADQRVFLRNQEIMGVTKNSVELISSVSSFRKSAGTILFDEKLVSNDANNFQFIGSRDRTWKDSIAVGYRDKIFTGIDPNTAQYLLLSYEGSSVIVKGSTKAFYDSADITTQVNLGGAWSVYSYRVTNPEKTYYWTDGTSVFYASLKLSGADPTSFRVSDNYKSKASDSNQCYSGSEIVPCS